MKLKNVWVYTLTILLLFSCRSNEGKFMITNKSNFDIDSLSILPDSKQQFIRLGKSKTIDFITKMNKVTSDGSYVISFKNSENNTIISKRFGYYTNGYQIEDVINITVLNDTIMINSKFDTPYEIK
ncbi:hypothetical protein KO504_06365 [Winogradskyella psychrotolerans]|uniref:hypothetical protein n=1 Tax=Winogradskyella psychrotolerans TaxID=1344585 RepID=UPI001C06DDAC|nr:hypothetical protein [Winogradskyella psychrotolerans]MBU2920960.1 hypothetical protein [Winogradskyella psychrotolerans]